MKLRSVLLALFCTLVVTALAMVLIPAFRPAGLMPGLIRLMHGAPAARPPAKPDASAASVVFAPGVAPDPQVREFLEAFAGAVRMHDGSTLKSRLSDRYTIEGLEPGMDAADFFAQAIAKLKSPNEIVVRAIENSNGVKLVTTEFRTPESGSKTRIFKFDAGGKLLGADFFSLQRQTHGM